MKNGLLRRYASRNDKGVIASDWRERGNLGLEIASGLTPRNDRGNGLLRRYASRNDKGSYASRNDKGRYASRNDKEACNAFNE
jgi:hypothetical protein